MPPDVRDWLPEDHLVWLVLDAVAEMGLGGFYAAYRSDGLGRPAYDPAMMVALVLYGYSRNVRSSRVIERECLEDIAYRVIAANERPDHSTIARFVQRYEEALAGVFGGVLRVCAKAGLVRTGVVAVDGSKMPAAVNDERALDFEEIAREIIEEAKRVDAVEDELYGDRRGDELPPELSSPEGRKAWLREAMREPADEQAAGADDTDAGAAGSGEEPSFEFEIDGRLPAADNQGRRGWLRDARRQLDQHRARSPRPVPRSRRGRLLDGYRQLDEDLDAERQANEAYEAYRAGGRMKDGRRFGCPPTPYRPPELPAGKINITDPDSRLLKATKGYVQGYNAQLVATEDQIIVAAEITIDSPDFGHLEPMVAAARTELADAGVTETPGVTLADSGYWHHEQMDRLAADGITVLIPPDSLKRKGQRPGWNGERYAWMRSLLATDPGEGLYRKRQGMIEPVFGQTNTTAG